MFGISEIHFERHITRETPVNEARRFLVYYLVKECGIRYSYVKVYVPSLTNHATAIHHVKTMQNMLEIYPKTRKLYNDFKITMETEGQTHLIRDYEKANNELELIKERIKSLKKLL